MNVLRQTEINRISSSQLYDSLPFSEMKIEIDNGDEYNMELDEIKLGYIYIGQGKYFARNSRIINVSAKSDCIISHFCFSGKSLTSAENNEIEMDNNEFSLFYKKAEQVNHLIQPTAKGGGHFFQVTIPKEILPKLYVEDSPFMNTFCNEIENGRSSHWAGKNLNITPDIKKLIYEMSNTPYQGYLKKLYLEAKLLELFVHQISAFDNTDYLILSKLKPGDKDRIYAVKDYLDSNINTNLTMIELAHMVGINQTKLKSGFKQLFGTTVFGYLTDIRMEKARLLILSENKNVGEVADLVGYQHPHHFAAAFKRKFGYSPGKLKA